MPLQGPVHDIQRWHKKKTGWKVEQLYMYNHMYITNIWIYTYIYIIFEEIHLFQKHATFVMARKLNII